ncbi:MAG: hypothetical protein D6B25_05880 [Desulfobulbaceae bacterium]|nr:MAG: hypothetical protein D6B25_05880 [Desulfobulbaceae bacterium]
MKSILSEKIRNFLIMARIELAGFSFVAVLGAMTITGRSIALFDVIALFIFNCLLVIFGFVHNDYEDYEIDKRLPELQHRPLVNGSISLQSAFTSSILLLLIAIGGAFLLYSPKAALLLSGALFLAGAYNKYSKSLLGADLFYGISAGALFLFGAAAVQESSDSFTLFTLAMALVMVLEHLFFNIASGQLKDVHFDRTAGVKTLAVALSHVEDDITVIHTSFKVICLSIKIITYGTIFSLFFFSILPMITWQFVLLLFFSAGSFGLTLKLLKTPVEEREKILEYSRKQEMFSKSLIPMVLLPEIGITWLLLFTVGPIIWFSFFNYLLNREFLGNPKTF